MKRTKFKKRPKTEALEAKADLIHQLPDKCEVKSHLCDGLFINIAHRHNRSLYKKTYKGLLWNYKHCISACQKCHDWMDENKMRRELIFVRERGNEQI